MHWIWGIILGLVFYGLMIPVQALLEATGLSPEDDSFFHAFALIALILLCVLIFKRVPRATKVRRRSPRVTRWREEEEE